MASKQKRYSSCIVAESQRIVKEHLHKRGHQNDFETTPRMVLYWWKVLNNAVFAGILQPPKKIICRNFHSGWLGYCKTTGQRDTIHLGIRRHQQDRKTFLIVLVHEMVHQYDWVTHRKMEHGDKFLRWVDTIDNAIGLPLGEMIEIGI